MVGLPAHLSRKTEFVHSIPPGSGYILPLLGQDSEFCAHLARSLNVIVLDADYAKAPEYPFPFPYYDVEDVLSHVLSSDQIYDTSRVTMSGFSAGGALALSVAGCSPVARDKVKGVIAFYPAVDFTKKGKKFDQTVPPPPPPPIHPPPPKQPWFKGRFPPFVSNFFVDCYLSPTQDRTDPRLSPCFITPSNLPPLLLFTADIDTLSKPAIRFAETLKEAGRDVRLRNFVGVGHGWDKLANPPSKGYEYKVEAYDMSVAFLKELYEEVPQSKL
jgi:acetyl esterase/lipase